MTADPFATIDPDRVAEIARRIGNVLAREQCTGVETFAVIACLMSVHLSDCSLRDRADAAHLLAEAILAGDGQMPDVAGHA